MRHLLLALALLLAGIGAALAATAPPAVPPPASAPAAVPAPAPPVAAPAPRRVPNPPAVFATGGGDGPAAVLNGFVLREIAQCRPLPSFERRACCERLLHPAACVE